MENQETTTETVVTKNPFDTDSWAAQPIVAEETKQEETTATQTESKEETKTEPQIDYSSFVKNDLGFENVDELKSFIQTAKKKKEETPFFKFENEESENFFNLLKENKKDELYDFLSKQNKIEKLSSGDVNAKTAEEIIKLGIQSKYPSLSQDEVDFAFEEKFSFPSKPVQGELEENDEFEKRVNEWESKIGSIQKKMIIEAKMAQPEIANLKNNLVLPEIKSTQQNTEPTKEDLQIIQELRDSFGKTLESDYKNFGGFNVTFKDESSGIEIPISYVPTDDEKVSLKNELSDFDHTEYFGNRWFTKEGKPQVPQMMEDKYFLENKAKILQKVANEAANQMRLKMIEMQSNIKLNNNGGQKTFDPKAPSQLDSLAAQVWGSGN